LKLRAAWSSSPVVELEGCRLNQISGLSLLATVPASAVVLSVASELAAASEVPPEAAVLSEESGAAAGGQAQRHGSRQGQCKCFSHRVLSFGVKNAGLSRPAPPDTFMLPENRGKNKVKFHRK